jgi:hypothetical protein
LELRKIDDDDDQSSSVAGGTRLRVRVRLHAFHAKMLRENQEAMRSGL